MVYFFAGCSCPADLKKRYRELAKKYHPDCPTGDAEMFKAIAAEYAAVKAGTVLPKPQKVWGKIKRRNAIIKLVKVQQSKQLKKMFVYHAYKNTLQVNGQQLTRTDLEIMAGLLEFKSAWIEIMVKENGID